MECVARGLDPLTTNLVVADPIRSENTICLAVSPSMKALGVKNRCRIKDIPRNIKNIVAQPRMQLYIDCAAEIHGVFLKYIAPEDVLDGEYRALTRVRLVPAKSRKAYSGLSRDEKNALKWIRETGLVLSMAEPVFLMEREIMPDTDIQLKTLSRRIEVFNMKIIMRRESVIFYSENHRFDNAVRRCLSN